MNKLILTSLLCLFTTISAFAYSGGSGTEANPYLISSKADMEQLATNVNNGQAYAGVYFRLTRNLTEAVDTLTTIVGNSDTRYFSGTFDGNGYTIAVKERGIFGQIKGATIKNLQVSGKITYYSYSHLPSSASSTDYYIGGICGYALSSHIANCRNSAKIETSFTHSSNRQFSGYYTGGICGYAISNTVISNCYNTNLVSGSINNTSYSYNAGTSYYGRPHSYSGGICGYTNYYDNSVYIRNCYNTGDIKSYAKTGGNFDGISSASGIAMLGGNIQNCFVADCKITGEAGSGNISITIARIGVSVISNCYADENTLLNGVSISNSDADSRNGKDATIANLQNQEWLSSTLSWDFESVWCMLDNGQFPELRILYPYQEVDIRMNIPTLKYGDQITLNAQTNNNVALVAYSSSDNTIAEILGNLLTAKKVGTVTITASQPSGNGFFGATSETVITIQKRDLTVIANNKSRQYGDANPAFDLLYSGFVNGNTSDDIDVKPNVKTTATTNSNAGTYPITVSDGSDNNYNLVYQNGTLTVSKRNLTVKANNKSRQYGNANPVIDVSYSGFVNGNTSTDIDVKPNATTTVTANSNAGTYLITVSGGSAKNYNFIYQNGTLTITKAPLLIMPQNVIRKQGEPNPVFELAYSGFKNNDTEVVLDELPSILCAADENSIVGIYDIILVGGHDNNYDYTLINGTLEVTPASGVNLISSEAATLYPNPVQTDLFIKTDFPVVKVEIYSLSGSLIKIEEQPIGKINMSGLSEGVYFVKIHADKGFLTHKVIKTP